MQTSQTNPDRDKDDLPDAAPEDDRIPGIYHGTPVAVHPEVGGDSTDPGNEDMGPDLPSHVAESGGVSYGEGATGGRGMASGADA